MKGTQVNLVFRKMDNEGDSQHDDLNALLRCLKIIQSERDDAARICGNLIPECWGVDESLITEIISLVEEGDEDRAVSKINSVLNK